MDNLRDEQNQLLVKDCSIFFNLKSMWSKTRRCTHELYFCISNKRDVSNQLMSQFASSNLWVRESLSEWVTALPRHEMVDPTVQVAAERGNFSLGQEYKQWVTGGSFYGQLCGDVWAFMPVTCTDAACWIELISYDHHLCSTIMSRAGLQQPNVPREMCGRLLWGQSNQDSRCMEDFLTKRTIQGLRSLCEAKNYTLAGAPDLCSLISSKKVFVKPTYNEIDFKITKPLADESLPLVSTFVEKWMRPGVPTSLQDELRAAMMSHNTKYNPSQKVWCAQNSKRPAVTPAEGHDAVDVVAGAEDPASLEDLQKRHDALCEKTFEEEKIKIGLLPTDPPTSRLWRTQFWALRNPSRFCLGSTLSEPTTPPR